MRVIAGRLGGRTIRAPKGRSTRPTTDRVREALFSILGDIRGQRVLDLYAGSGALGIEALSRDAARATFVESGRAALAVLRENLDSLGLLDQSTVIPMPVERAAGALEGSAPYDLVLCDPPWPDVPRAMQGLARTLTPRVFSPGARLVVEHPARAPLEFPLELPFTMQQTRIWGDTAATLLLFSAKKP